MTVSRTPITSPRPTKLSSTPLLADPNARWALAAVVAVMLCQTVFLVFGCDWDLCNDEAEYWAWSRQLDWSYYSRGPLIAWVIRLATELLGGISVKLTGSQMVAARLPAVLLGGLTAWGVFRLASETTGQRRAAMLSVVLLPAIPILAIGGVVITSDTPLVCCWTWAAVWTYRGLRSDNPRAWTVAGLIGALGVWAKYSFLAFPASVGLFLLTSRTNRRQLLRPGFWTMMLLCLVIGLAPILIWNFRHGWAGAGQLADRVGLSSRATWASIWPVLTFLGGDGTALGGVWWIAGMAAVIAAIAQVIRQAKSETIADTDKLVVVSDSGLIYLLCLWGVIWTACLAASVLGETEANWMVPGYISLVILIGLRVDRVFVNGGIKKWIYAASWCLCLAVVVVIHHVEWFYPTIASYVPKPTAIARSTASVRADSQDARASGTGPRG